VSFCSKKDHDYDANDNDNVCNVWDNGGTISENILTSKKSFSSLNGYYNRYHDILVKS